MLNRDKWSSLGLGEDMFPVAERMAQEVLAIPVHPALSDADRMFIVDGLLSQGV